MVKTLTFSSRDLPEGLHKGIKTSKNLHWIHIDSKDDEGYADLVSYELSDLGMSHDLTKNLRPNIRHSDKYQIIKLVFPREVGIYVNDKENLVVRFIISKNFLITISNYSQEIEILMNEIYVNKIKVHDISKMFTEIVSNLLAQSYPVLENLDSEINNIQKAIFSNKNKKENFQKSEHMRESVYHIFTYLGANAEVFEELKMQKGFIKYNHEIDHLRSKMKYMRDILGGHRENLLHMSDVYLGTISANMSKYMYKLTILSSVLLVPTIVSGLFGMNVDLPGFRFWPIVSLSIILSFMTGFFMSWWARR